jgi:predicted acylesterase/phospholipase RssA
MAESVDITQAKTILRGQAAPLADLQKLAERLKRKKSFGYARRILAQARKDPALRENPELRLKLAHQHALCTYKDPDLPVDDALHRALEILTEVEDLKTTKTQETLGLAGAIHKRMWESDGQKQHLERSCAYYYKGYEQGPTNDYGYTGINAAFVSDLLANDEEKQAAATGAVSGSATARREEATAIRADLVAKLPPLIERAEYRWLEKEWWFVVTIAEAYFGLGRYQEALLWLGRAAVLPDVPEWEREATARQLASLAGLRAGNLASISDLKNSEPWQVLCEFLGNDAAGVRSAFIGKVGLALSGGGFRASLYHIGVLARLAELDVLRHVEALSCVSGGSIIGAHYYLELRKLLQTKTDDQIARDDYIDIVQRIERDFLTGVQRNIRTRVTADVLTSLKMIFVPNYSRTLRAGELYEKELFSKVQDGAGDGPRWLNDLFVNPLGLDGKPIENFTPKYHNWRRAAKVPILVLNATTLNTGHNWQFTASWMGEPPGGIDTETDGNYRLRRMYYGDAPKTYQTVRLGYAVAASACVPGIFEPLVFADLYPGKKVRLVDGGVHDNQGISSLIEQGCSVLLVSDASGQMAAQNEPSGGMLGVPLRSNDVLMSRVREAQYQELLTRRRSSQLRGLMFVHLKKDLEVDPVDWVGCEDPHDASEDARPQERRGVLTTYGIHKEVQERVAAIRTDLDSFSDAEAFALMTSGYLMTKLEFSKAIPGIAEPDGMRPQWRFLAVALEMQRAEKSGNLIKILNVSCYRLLKVWKLLPALQVTAWVVGFVALAGFLFASWRWASLPVVTLGMVGSTVAVLVLSSIVGKTVVRIGRFRETLTRIGIGVGMSLIGWLLAAIHLYVFDKWYLHLGRINLERESPAVPLQRPYDTKGAVSS